MKTVVNNMTETHDLVIMEEAVKHSAKAALRHQKQTAQVNQKVTAIGMITNDVHTRLQAISNIDEREFEQLTDVIEGQITLSRQAKDLDTQWRVMVSGQSSELERLNTIRASLETHNTTTIQSIETLNTMSQQSHIDHTADIESMTKQITQIDNQLKTLDTTEDLSNIKEVLALTKEQIEKEYAEQATHQAAIEEKMTDLRIVSSILLKSTGHYTSVIQTVTAKVDQIVSIVDVLNKKVSQLSPGIDGVSQDEILKLFQRLGEQTTTDDVKQVGLVDPVNTLDEPSNVIGSEVAVDADTTDAAPTESNNWGTAGNTTVHESETVETSVVERKSKSDARDADTSNVRSEFPPRSKEVKPKPKSKWQFWKK